MAQPNATHPQRDTRRPTKRSKSIPKSSKEFENQLNRDQAADSGVVPIIEYEKAKGKMETEADEETGHMNIFYYQNWLSKNNGIITAAIRGAMSLVMLFIMVLGFMQEPRGKSWEKSLADSAGWYRRGDREFYRFAMFLIWIVVLSLAYARYHLDKIKYGTVEPKKYPWVDRDPIVFTKSLTTLPFPAGVEGPLPLSKCMFHIHCALIVFTHFIYAFGEWRNKWYNSSLGLYGWSLAFCIHPKECNIWNDVGHICVGFIAAAGPLCRPQSVPHVPKLVLDLWKNIVLVPTFYYVIYDVKHPHSARLGNFFGEYLPSYIFFSSVFETLPLLYAEKCVRRRRRESQIPTAATTRKSKHRYDLKGFQKYFDVTMAVVLGLSSLTLLVENFGLGARGGKARRFEGRPTTFPRPDALDMSPEDRQEAKDLLKALKKWPYRFKKIFMVLQLLAIVIAIAWATYDTPWFKPYRDKYVDPGIEKIKSKWRQIFPSRQGLDSESKKEK